MFFLNMVASSMRQEIKKLAKHNYISSELTVSTIAGKDNIVAN